jgi:hypothetical protein
MCLNVCSFRIRCCRVCRAAACSTTTHGLRESARVQSSYLESVPAPLSSVTHVRVPSCPRRPRRLCAYACGASCYGGGRPPSPTSPQSDRVRDERERIARRSARTRVSCVPVCDLTQWPSARERERESEIWRDLALSVLGSMPRGSGGTRSTARERRSITRHDKKPRELSLLEIHSPLQQCASGAEMSKEVQGQQKGTHSYAKGALFAAGARAAACGRADDRVLDQRCSASTCCGAPCARPIGCSLLPAAAEHT